MPGNSAERMSLVIEGFIRDFLIRQNAGLEYVDSDGEHQILEDDTLDEYINNRFSSLIDEEIENTGEEEFVRYIMEELLENNYTRPEIIAGMRLYQSDTYASFFDDILRTLEAEERDEAVEAVEAGSGTGFAPQHRDTGNESIYVPTPDYSYVRPDSNRVLYATSDEEPLEYDESGYLEGDPLAREQEENPWRRQVIRLKREQGSSLIDPSVPLRRPLRGRIINTEPLERVMEMQGATRGEREDAWEIDAVRENPIYINRSAQEYIESGEPEDESEQEIYEQVHGKITGVLDSFASQYMDKMNLSEDDIGDDESIFRTAVDKMFKGTKNASRVIMDYFLKQGFPKHIILRVMNELQTDSDFSIFEDYVGRPNKIYKPVEK